MKRIYVFGFNANTHVMPGLVPGIHAEPQGNVLWPFPRRRRVEDGAKPGHDDMDADLF